MQAIAFWDKIKNPLGSTGIYFGKLGVMESTIIQSIQYKTLNQTREELRKVWSRMVEDDIVRNVKLKCENKQI